MSSYKFILVETREEGERVSQHWCIVGVSPRVAALLLWPVLLLLGWTSVTPILLKLFPSSGIQLFPQVQLQLAEMREKLSLTRSHVDGTQHPGETVLSCCPAD